MKKAGKTLDNSRREVPVAQSQACDNCVVSTLLLTAQDSDGIPKASARNHNVNATFACLLPKHRTQ